MIRALVAMLVLASPVLGQPCYQQVARPSTVVVERHYEQPYIAQFVPFVVSVPTYSSTYVPGYQPVPLIPPPAGVAQPLLPPAQGQGFQAQALSQAQPQDRLLAILERIEARLGTTAQSVDQTDFGQVLVQNCAACHDRADGAAKGKGFVITEGGRVDQALTDRSAMKIASRTHHREMPPGKPLSDDAQGRVMKWLQVKSK